MTHDAQSASGKVKRIAGHTLHRMTPATVERLWTSLVPTHDIAGMTSNDGRELAVAVPRQGSKGWIGYTMDGQTWFGCHIVKGTEATQLLRAVAKEVGAI